MRILYFTDTFSPQINGVTNTLNRLGRYLSSHHIDHMFLAPEYNNQTSVINDKHVKRFKSISLPAYPECRISIPNYSNLCRLADRFQPDIIHLMTPAGIGFAGLKYAQERNLPVVSSFTTNFDIYLKYYKLEFFNELLWDYFRWFHNSCHINFTPSQDAIQFLRLKGIENIKLWSRGIDLQRFNPSYKNQDLRCSLHGKDKLTFLYVGRLAPEKDLDILMGSIKKINSLWPGKAQFIIAGDGPTSYLLQESAPENVVFTGFLTGESLSSLYASCDVFVFPSSTETFGNVVLEAMASGLPVIAVNSGGVRDSIVHGYNGFLCNPRDVESFSQSISQFLSNEQMVTEMSENARQSTLTKSWDTIFDKLLSDYILLIEKLRRKEKLTTKTG